MARPDAPPSVERPVGRCAAIEPMRWWRLTASALCTDGIWDIQHAAFVAPGAAVVGHLADLGWTDIVQIDKGPLPNPGGSTGHASNFIFPVDHNKEMALLGVQSANQYRELDRDNVVLADGTGKTTTVEIFEGLLTPDGGTVEVTHTGNIITSAQGHVYSSNHPLDLHLAIRFS